jgi:hypothetical protein
MADIEKIAELSELLREIRACIARSYAARDECESSRILLSACLLYTDLTIGLKSHQIRYHDIGTRLHEMMWIVREIRYYSQQHSIQKLMREFSD